MLTKEMMDRIKRAGEYQKKAILELLPEGMEGHLEVIFGEVRLMAREVAADLTKECVKTFWETAGDGQRRADASADEGRQQDADMTDGKGGQRQAKQTAGARETGGRSVRKVAID
ncbi:MAG: hypothetical protein K6E18_09130 [Lachnospiraceae bacterium]|nr:hypothetical protein [Lachnospiraceae bacterium]